MARPPLPFRIVRRIGELFAFAGMLALCGTLAAAALAILLFAATWPIVHGAAYLFPPAEIDAIPEIFFPNGGPDDG